MHIALRYLTYPKVYNGNNRRMPLRREEGGLKDLRKCTAAENRKGNRNVPRFVFVSQMALGRERIPMRNDASLGGRKRGGGDQKDCKTVFWFVCGTDRSRCHAW